MKEHINILFSCDTHYAMPLTVCITSIFENNKENCLHLFVLYSNLTEVQQTKLYELAKNYSQEIHLIHVEEHYFSNAPTLRWSKETYYRLLIYELLPSSLDKILYLDCDIIINKPLNTLYNQNFNGKSICALRTEMKYEDYGKRLGIETDKGYFQCGVLLFDLKKCHDKLSYQKSMDIINNLGSNIQVVDQDVLNVLFSGEIEDLDINFNNDEITNFFRNNYNRLFNYTNNESINFVTVFHYAAGKPWNNIFSGSCEDVWYKYLKLSPYKDLYYERYSTLKYKLFRTGLMKYIFYKYTGITPHIDKMFLLMMSESTYKNFKNFYRQTLK